MSAYLLGMGFRADMGTCVRKLVWLKLIDACEEDGTRIFPAIATIARAAQCSTRQAQREMKAFQDIGLLRLVKKGGNGPRSTNEYALDLDMVTRIARDGWDHVAEEVGLGRAAADGNPDDVGQGLVGQGKGDTVSPFGGDGKGDTGDAERVTPETAKGDKLCHPTPPEPSIDPSEREARASADGQEGEPGEGEVGGAGARRDDPRKFEARVKRLAEGWPGWANSSTAWAVRQFAALTDAERAAAERCRAAYLAHCGGKALSVGTYLAEKKWLDLPAQALASVDPAANPQLAAPFGKLWGAKRMALLIGSPPQPSPQASGFLAAQLADPGEAGRRARLERQARFGWPGVNRMDELAAQAKPWPIAAFEAAQLERLAEATEQVWTGTPLWDAWRDEFARRGWPWLPEMGRQRVASFPAGGPEGLEAFERAVRDGVGTVAQARKAG